MESYPGRDGQPAGLVMVRIRGTLSLGTSAITSRSLAYFFDKRLENPQYGKVEDATVIMDREDPGRYG